MMKGIANNFRIGDIESLFYFYLCFVFLSEILVIFLFKKISHIANTPFDFWSCFITLLIVPLIETFLLGLITEAFNYIFLKNEYILKNNVFSIIIQKTKIPFIMILLMIIVLIYIVLNIDGIVDFLFHSDILFINLFIILFTTMLSGIIILFVLKLFLSYKLKLKTMNYQFEIEKQKAIQKKSDQLISWEKNKTQ